MGLAADDVGRLRLKKRSVLAYMQGKLSLEDKGGLGGTGCSFACHNRRSPVSTLTLAEDDRTTDTNCALQALLPPPHKLSPEQLAYCDNDPPVRLRIDAARDGVISLLDTLIADPHRATNDFKVSFGTMSDTYYPVSAASGNLESIKAKVGHVKLGYQDETSNTLDDTTAGLDTIAEDAFTTFAAKYGTDITNAAAAGHKQYVLLVTDGVRSQSGKFPGTTCQNGHVRVMLKNEFSPISNLPVTIVVLYTKYLDESSDPTWVSHVSTVHPCIESNLKTFVTDPRFFAMAGSEAQILQAFDDLLDEIRADAGPLQLTQ